MKTKSFGVTTLQFALAIFLLSAGIYGLFLHDVPENHIADLFIKFTKMDSQIDKILSFVICTAEVACGVMLVLEKFIGKALFSAVSMILITIIWIFIVIIVDFLGERGLAGGSVFQSVESLLDYLKMLSTHLLVFGSVFVVMSE